MKLPTETGETVKLILKEEHIYVFSFPNQTFYKRMGLQSVFCFFLIEQSLMAFMFASSYGKVKFSDALAIAMQFCV